MHPLNSRTTDTAAAVKNWTFIGRSLKKYLYGIRLINWRGESYWAKFELCTMERARWWRIALTYFPTAEVAFLPFFSSDLQKKFQRYNNTLYCDSVLFLFFTSRPSWRSFDKTRAQIRSADPSDTPDATSRIPCYLYMYVYLWSLYIFSGLL